MSEQVLPDSSTPFGQRVRQRLREEAVIWLTTIGQDGTPQPNPVWFLWDDESILIYNLPTANRVAHIRERPQVSLNFDSNGQGGNIVVLTGRAEILENFPLGHQCPPFLEKYREWMTRIGRTPEEFGHAYSVPIRIKVSKVRGH